MKFLLIKWLVVFHIMQKNAYFTLFILVAATIITRIRGNIIVSRICLISYVFFMVYVLFFSIACMEHRKKHQRFRVYLSFSERRIPGMARYINDYLKPAFYVFNIDYYDFREHKQFHYLNENAICEEIDKNLAVSDIFLRFIGHGLEPNKPYLVNDLWNDIRFNPFTRSLSKTPDYTDYEVNASFDKFGFNNRNNRFQIMPLDIMVPPKKHIQTIYIDSKGPALRFTIRLINILSRGYQEQQYWKRSALFWRMRDQIMAHSEGI